MNIAHHWVQVHNKALSTVHMQLCLIHNLLWISASTQYCMKKDHHWVQIHNKALSTIYIQLVVNCLCSIHLRRIAHHWVQILNNVLSIYQTLFNAQLVVICLCSIFLENWTSLGSSSQQSPIYSIYPTLFNPQLLVVTCLCSIFHENCTLLGSNLQQCTIYNIYIYIYIQLYLIHNLLWFSASALYSINIAHHWDQIPNKVLSMQSTLFNP